MKQLEDEKINILTRQLGLFFKTYPLAPDCLGRNADWTDIGTNTNKIEVMKASAKGGMVARGIESGEI